MTRLEVEVESKEHLQLFAAAVNANDEVEFESTEFEPNKEKAFEVQVRELAIKLQAINFYYGGVQRMTRAMPMVAIEMAADITGTAVEPVAACAVAPTFDELE